MIEASYLDEHLDYSSKLVDIDLVSIVRYSLRQLWHCLILTEYPSSHGGLSWKSKPGGQPEVDDVVIDRCDRVTRFPSEIIPDSISAPRSLRMEAFRDNFSMIHHEILPACIPVFALECRKILTMKSKNYLCAIQFSCMNSMPYVNCVDFLVVSNSIIATYL